MQVHYDEGVAIHIGPEPCVSAREGRGEASVGEHIGQPLSREITESRTPTLLMRRKASGRRGAEADDARAGEVRPFHSSCETDEQSWDTGGGAGGAKGRGQGKHAPAAHAPGSGPGKRVTGAGASCTESGTKPEDGPVHLAPPPPRPGHVADGVLRPQAGRGRRRRRADVAGLRGRSRWQDRRPAWKGPARCLPGAAGPAWLAQMVSGFFNYHAVPTNARPLSAFRDRVVDLWKRSLRRRSQRDFTTWERMRKLASDWLPRPRILHPWPSERVAVKHPRWEPSARMGPARFCAGGAQK